MDNDWDLVKTIDRVKITPRELQLLTQTPTFLTKLFPTTIRNKISHIRQYEFAVKFIKGKKCLDAACGTGYGSEILRRNGNHVIGVDINPENIDFARMSFSDNEYYVGNIEDLKYFQTRSLMLLCLFRRLSICGTPKKL